jgi:hypothetical protein
MKTAIAMSRIPGPSLRDYPRGVWDAIFGGREPVRDSNVHLDAVMQWLCRAQDATPDRGLARMYHLRDGWGASYPETTGYAIPTFLAYADLTGNEEFTRRAVEMAEWESTIQMPSGAVQGGIVSTTKAPTPAIFNTGQVLFGWCAAYERTRAARFGDSARRAAQYLVDVQAHDGAWRRDLSDYCDSPDDSYAFNVRTAWALMLAGNVLGERRFNDAAIANVDFVLRLAHENGWIEKNCLNRPEQPLLHTIAYSHQGLLELAELAGHERARALVLRGSTALIESFERNGQLYGRYDQSWQPTVTWRCLTGEAQTAIVWFRLGEITGSDAWKTAASRLLTLLKRTHALEGTSGVRGGVKGSHPITGAYGRLEYLNWAAKFFADALMLDMGVATASRRG